MASPIAVRRVLRGGARRVKQQGRRRAWRLGSFFTRSERLASLYYLLVPDAFGREHRAVLAGRRRYTAELEDGRQRYLLRRNVHMLEKGLSMSPRRDVFAVDYIRETVASFQSLQGDVAGACEADRELQWANDVLTAYFDVAGPHPVIDAARAAFAAAPLGSDPRSPTPGLRPYRRVLDAPPPVAYEDLLALAERRRSVRWFSDEPVRRELIERAIEVAALSPSACNRQPFEFRVFDDPEQVAEVADVPMGTRGWKHNIPVFVVIVGTLSAFFSERDRHLIYTDGCLAAMSFVLALEAQGLSSCCVNWPDIAEREARMAELLDLQPHERPVMCIAVGHPDPEGLVPFSHKRPTHQLLRWNGT